MVEIVKVILKDSKILIFDEFIVVLIESEIR